MRNILLTLCFLSMLSCQNKDGLYNYEVKKVIAIQSFADFEPHKTQSVFDKIQMIIPDVILLPTVDLPKTAFNNARNRYRADSLLKLLKPQSTDTTILGLTTKDISTTVHNVTDWGVMGLGYTPGSACVVSTFRLKKENLNEQLFKVAIHELGHTEGLPHCKSKTCYMRDAEGGNPLNEEVKFCNSCAAYLKNRGWTVP